MNQKDLCNKLMELDREFAKTTEEIGVEGWVQYFDENGAMAPSKGPVIRGKDAIRKAMAPFFDRPGNSLKWEPEYAEVSEDGSLGYTYGSYLRTSIDESGNTLQGSGRYTSIWRSQDNGCYKIVLDIGN